MPVQHDTEEARAYATRQLAELFATPDRAFVVHYALQQQFRRGVGDQSLPVAAIAVRSLATGAARIFSINDEARRAGIELVGIDADTLLRLEYALLFRYNDLLAASPDCRFLHWYMRDDKYGFAALESRFLRVLSGVNGLIYGSRSVAVAAPFLAAPGGERYPVHIPDDAKVDLARVIRDMYGIDRLGLQPIAERNGLDANEAIAGDAEPGAFERGNHARLEWSTSSKARLIADIARLAHDRRLILAPTQARPAATGSRIFINYRREDSAGAAGRLHDTLAQAFGAANVFLDVEDLAAGENFDDALKRELEACDVFLAVIGRQWTTITGSSGRLRLSEPDDLVRAEIRAALARSIPVIPVRVDGAAFPTERDLPADLKPLLRRQAVELRHDRFHRDATALIEDIREALARRAGGGR